MLALVRLLLLLLRQPAVLAAAAAKQRESGLDASRGPDSPRGHQRLPRLKVVQLGRPSIESSLEADDVLSAQQGEKTGHQHRTTRQSRHQQSGIFVLVKQT